MTSTSPVSEGPLLILRAAMFVVLPVGLFAPKGMAVLFIISTLASLISNNGRITYKLKFSLPSAIALMFAIWACISASWSMSPLMSLKSALIALTTIGAAFVFIERLTHLDTRSLILLKRSFCWGGIFGYALLSVEIFCDASITAYLFELTKGEPATVSVATNRLKSGLLVAAVMLFPWCVSVFRQFPRALAGALTALATITVWCGHSTTAKMVILVAIAIFFMTKYTDVRKFILSAVTIVFLIFMTGPVVPFLLPDPRIESKYYPIDIYDDVFEDLSDSRTELRVYSKLSNSVLHRIHIWQKTSENIIGSPFIGLGFNSSKYLYSRKDREHQTFLPNVPDRTYGIFTEPIPLHPHNIMLQIWLELGGIGAFLTFGFIATWMKRTGHNFRNSAKSFTIYATTFFTIFTVCLSSLGAWQTWWISTITMIAAAAHILLMCREPQSVR